MEESSNEQGGGDSVANDWRTLHEPNLRKQATYAIVEMVKICSHQQYSENDIKKAAIKFENKIYGMAKDKDDYLRRINRKVLALKQGQSLSTSLPSTQSQQPLPPQNNTPESSGLPTQVPITTVSAAQNLNVQTSEEGVHSSLLPQAQQQQQAEGSFNQSENQPYELQRAHPENATNTSDWREETYQKIKALKEKYVLVLSSLLRAVSDQLRQIDSLSQQNIPHEERVERLKAGKVTLEQVLDFLYVSKSSVSEMHRDEFSRCEGKVLKFAEFHQTVMTQRAMQKQQQQQQVYQQQPQTNHQQQQEQQEQFQIPENEMTDMSPSASSPQMQNYSSPLLVEQQTHLPTSFHKTGTSSQSGGSPLVPNANQIQTESQGDPLVTLPSEPPISERPIDRLIKAFQSSSPESLARSVSGMRSVISLTDRFAGSVPHSMGGYRARLGEDLSERTRLRVQQVDTNPTKRFKRSVTAIPLDSSASKVNKIEPSYALQQEIIEINRRLVETVVSICSEDVCPSEVVTSGLTVVVVTCSYVPVALSATFKALYNSGQVSQIQPLRLLVPENYPHSAITLKKPLFDGPSVQKLEDLNGRARSRFALSMEKYSEAMSLKEIAKVWDECGRATMLEYAERHGGGTFSSKYGRWESVLAKKLLHEP